MLVALAAILVCILMGLVGQPDWWWSAMMAATLALRRTAPVAMATVAMCISLAHLLAEASFLLPGDAILLVAAYSMAAHSRERHSIIGSILGLTFLTVFTGRAIAGGQVPAHSSAVLIIGLVSLQLGLLGCCCGIVPMLYNKQSIDDCYPNVTLKPARNSLRLRNVNTSAMRYTMFWRTRSLVS